MVEELRNMAIYVSWQKLYGVMTSGVMLLLGGIFALFSYTMDNHERHPHAGSASSEDIVRLERIASRVENKVDSLAQYVSAEISKQGRKP